MDRKQIKRLLALLKSEVEHGRDFGLELPEGFKESFEGQPAFRGWINYHVTWGVDDDDAWKVVLLKESLVKSWERELVKRTPIITKAGETVTPEQYAQMEATGAKTLAELEQVEESKEKPKKKLKKRSKKRKK